VLTTTSSGVSGAPAEKPLAAALAEKPLAAALAEKPLAAASKRLRMASEAKRKKLPDQASHPDVAIGLAATGLSAPKIAAALGQSVDIVKAQLTDGRETILAIRDALKLDKMVAMKRVEARMWPRIERDIETANAKDVDALARAAMNLEKMQAQVSGEGAQVTVKNVSDAPNVDLKILIQQLINE
jgi:hypothetical protein